MTERLPLAVFVARLETNGVHRAPGLHGIVEYIHEIDRQQFVGHGQVQADEAH